MDINKNGEKKMGLMTMTCREIIDIFKERLKSISDKNDKKTFLLGILKISLTKIRDSIGIEIKNPEAPKPEGVQKVHFQVIENTIYQYPDLIDENIQDKFFSIKNAIDTGAEEFPLKKEEAKKAIKKILDLVEEERRKDWLDKLKKLFRYHR